jgi:hypothetical protein
MGATTACCAAGWLQHNTRSVQIAWRAQRLSMDFQFKGAEMHRRRVVAASVFILGMVSGPVGAQDYPIDRGSLLLAGTASATGAKASGDESGTFSLDVNPRLAFFVTRGLAVNANLQLSHTSSSSFSGWQWGVGPGATYYFGGPSSRVYPFVTGRALFVRTHSRWRDGDFDAESSAVAWLAGGGVVLMLVKHVGVSGELFYQWTEYSQHADTSDSLRRQWYGLRIGVAAFVF